MTDYIKKLEWRYATKQYDTTKKVSPEDLEMLKKALQLSASSYGLQPYKILIIEDQEVRNKLFEASWNQSQVTDASHLIVFAVPNHITLQHIEEYMENISKTRGIPLESLTPFKEVIENTVLTLPSEVQQTWAAKQTYIALGNLLSAAAHLQIDATPMEGFNAKEYDEILQLDKQGLATTVIAAIGYRSENDANQALKKVRKNQENLFINI